MSAQPLRVSFRAKVQELHYAGREAPEYRYVQVPTVKRAHCDMPAFRASRAFGCFANSDLFMAMLARALQRAGIGRIIRLDDLPAGVTVDTSGFLASVTIDLPDAR